MTVTRLCFGTSTFAAGRLIPDKDSGPGIAALAAAVDAGIRMIHSNPKLQTQWAIREALSRVHEDVRIRHVVKVELPLGASEHEACELIHARLTQSAQNLGIDRVDAVTIEIDLKRTRDRALLVDVDALTAFYDFTAKQVASFGGQPTVFAYCHSPAHLDACLRTTQIGGFAAQYNPVEAWPGLYLDRIALSDRPFLAMAPLRRSLLVDTAAPTARDRLRSLRWVLGHPAVTAAVITISSSEHLLEVIDAAQHPLRLDQVRQHLEAWRHAPVPNQP
ncbi:hypothetical protein [Catenulispora subtropica]|uniref:Aldo/keto reductase n=1 Tax=Catenulispora subtropica TaxID=450798 RepID=A0ABN2T7Z4_9ACTN